MELVGAEIISGIIPHWHVASTVPNHERLAAAHLVARRFGCYLPEYKRAIPQRRGHRAQIISRPLFPGYLFIFCWDIEMHARRICACPGVINLLYTGETPAIIPDEVIDGIQFREGALEGEVKKPRRRRRKRHGLAVDSGGEVVAIRSYSAWSGIEKLDDRGRISALHKALGLATSLADGQHGEYPHG